MIFLRNESKKNDALLTFFENFSQEKKLLKNFGRVDRAIGYFYQRIDLGYREDRIGI